MGRYGECAAITVSRRVVELSEAHDLPIEEIASKLPDADRAGLQADCARCAGMAKFTGCVVATECSVVRNGSESCEQSWIALHPEDYLDEEGALRLADVRCGARSGRIVCPALFQIRQTEEGTVAAEVTSGRCIIELAGRIFEKKGWSPLDSAVLHVGLMYLEEDENGEVIARNRADVTAPEQQDALPLGQNPIAPTYRAELYGDETAGPPSSQE